MVGILDLPSELLFQIVGPAVTSTHPVKGSVRYRPIEDIALFPRNLYCVPELELAGQHPALDLLLTCRKLYQETKEYLSKTPHVLDLDIAIIDDHWIWPTWRNLPMRKDGAFDRINVHFIHCCTEDERHLQEDWSRAYLMGVRRSTYDRRSLAQGFLNWRPLNPLRNLVGNDNIDASVANTLSDFLTQPFSGKIMGSPIICSADVLAFHIDTTIYADSNRLLSESEVPMRKIRGLFHLDFDRLYFASAEMAKLLWEDVQDYIAVWFQQSKEADEAPPRIGKILFFLDGALAKELDPTDLAVVGA